MTLSYTFFKVVWNGSSPTNYNDPTRIATARGGIDNTHAERYNRMISITGTAQPTSVTANNSIIVNNVEIVFSSTTLDSVIADINALTSSTGVFAHQLTVAGYLTLTNAPTFEGRAISVLAGNGNGLSDLGLTEVTYQGWPNIVGSAAPSGSGNSIKINGIAVSFTNTNPVDMAAAINDLTPFHNVVAMPAANRLQLAATDGQPFSLADIKASSVSNLGFSVGSQGGTPSTLDLSLDKERATMRWNAVVYHLTQQLSPVFFGNIIKPTTIDAEAPPATLEFTVGYDRLPCLTLPDTLDSGSALSGAAAVKRLVALALTTSLVGDQEIFDPTILTFGDHRARGNPTQIVSVSADPLDTSLATVEGNLTVTLLYTLLGEVSSTSALPTSATTGDAYLDASTNRLWVWSGSAWEDRTSTAIRAKL